MNLGYIELGGGGVTARIYYDTNWIDDDPSRDSELAPLINGPRGYCLDLTNLTGARQSLTVSGINNGAPLTFDIPVGNPVTSRSRTAAQMAALGYTTRGNVGTVEIG